MHLNAASIPLAGACISCLSLDLASLARSPHQKTPSQIPPSLHTLDGSLPFSYLVSCRSISSRLSFFLLHAAALRCRCPSSCEGALPLPQASKATGLPCSQLGRCSTGCQPHAVTCSHFALCWHLQLPSSEAADPDCSAHSVLPSSIFKEIAFICLLLNIFLLLPQRARCHYRIIAYVYGQHAASGHWSEGWFPLATCSQTRAFVPTAHLVLSLTQLISKTLTPCRDSGQLVPQEPARSPQAARAVLSSQPARSRVRARSRVPLSCP